MSKKKECDHDNFLMRVDSSAKLFTVTYYCPECGHKEERPLSQQAMFEAWAVYHNDTPLLETITEYEDASVNAFCGIGDWPSYKEHTCRRVQLSDPETHVVVSREDLLTLLTGIDPFDFYDEELLQKMRKLLKERHDGE